MSSLVCCERLCEEKPIEKPQAVYKKVVEIKWGCAWKECPDNVERKMKYFVDEKNPRIATNIGCDWCTIIGNTPLPLNKVTSWSIKILKSYDNDGNKIWIGVAPFDIDQNEYCNYSKCGWYFDCYNSILCSGPPHNYNWKEYGPRKKEIMFAQETVLAL